MPRAKRKQAYPIILEDDDTILEPLTTRQVENELESIRSQMYELSQRLSRLSISIFNRGIKPTDPIPFDDDIPF